MNTEVFHAPVAGARKRLYFMRERILLLAPVGESYVRELVHARPYTWKGNLERLLLLEAYRGLERQVELLDGSEERELRARVSARWAISSAKRISRNSSSDL